MGEPVLIREWQIFGLPTDAVSTDNSLMVKFGQRWPLMIDPQGQANKWIRKMEGKQGLVVSKLNNPNMLRHLEACIRNGKPLLIEDIGETLDPALEPVLQKAVYKQGGRILIRLGDSDVDYDEDFKFYLTTNMPNPHYLPEICIKVTIINFTVTVDGLEDQLLGDVVKKERPDIEEKKNNLIVSIAADKKQMQGLEDKILQLLSESTGNILDDEILINTLAESKVTSGVISERLAESEITEKEINVTRSSYRPVAVRGSIIYFVIADLGLVDPMYQFSLEFFKRLFNQCIDEADKDDDLQQRLKNLLAYQTEMIFLNICRSLFEAHKLMFAFLLCAQIMLQRKDINKVEWNLLLKGAGIVDREAQAVACPDPELVEPRCWDLICELENVPGPLLEPEAKEEPAEGEEEEEAAVAEEFGPKPFQGIASHMADNWAKWTAWRDVDDAHLEPLPAPWDAQLSDFQKLLVVKALREELGNQAVSAFVKKQLGPIYVAPPSTSVAQLYKDLNAYTPAIFVLSQGADPTNSVFRFADAMKYSERISLISLGQGQGPRAEALIESGTKTGDWVLLQNCHLAKSWMDKLNEICLDLAEMAFDEEREGELHDDFRLWLTSFPAAYFPVPVLQNSIKLTNEPPKGLRMNLLRSYDIQLSDKLFDSCKKPKEFKKLCFGLAFFHATVQERRKFGPLGWNIRYQFNDSDMETAIEVLQGFLDDQPVIPWDALQYVTGHINYGGRVTDDWDRRCLMTILCRFYETPILEDSYKLSDSGTYFAPEDTNFDGYKAYLDALPHNDNPEIFGMHANANITFMVKETTAMLNTILSLQPRDAGGAGGETPDEMVTRLAVEMQAELPEILDRDDAGPTTFTLNDKGQMDSLATVLGQEIVKFNRLLHTMKTTLVDIRKAIKGLVVMSLDLDKMYTSMQNNQVPHLWENVGFASLKPLSTWMVDMKFRMVFMRDWLLNGQPVTFALQVFYFPQGFLTGALQNHSRKYQIPINALDFKFDVQEEEADQITEAPEDGVIVYGLWMEGAQYHRKQQKIADSEPGEMYNEMLPILFTPQRDYKTPPGEYTCPVYKTSLRQGVLSTTGISTNFVLGVDLPAVRTPDECVLQGTAFLLNLNV
jgi:dynein heavy chain